MDTTAVCSFGRFIILTLLIRGELFLSSVDHFGTGSTLRFYSLNRPLSSMPFPLIENFTSIVVFAEKINGAVSFSEYPQRFKNPLRRRG